MRAHQSRCSPNNALSRGAWLRRRVARRNARLGHAPDPGQRMRIALPSNGLQDARREQRVYPRAQLDRLAQPRRQALAHRVWRRPAEHVCDATAVLARARPRRPDEGRLAAAAARRDGGTVGARRRGLKVARCAARSCRHCRWLARLPFWAGSAVAGRRAGLRAAGAGGVRQGLAAGADARRGRRRSETQRRARVSAVLWGRQER